MGQNNKQTEFFLGKKWRDVVGYEGLYKISEYGDLFSIQFERILKGGFHTAGYRKADLLKNGEQKTITLHKLVATAFIPNPEEKICVNHKDGDKKNNHISNLEWATYQENTQHAFKTGLIKPVKNVGAQERLSKAVNQLSLDGEFIKRWNSQSEVMRMLGFDSSKISKACRGVVKTAYGHIWEFAV